MKKETMYNRLQKQYEKLNQSIQKAMKTGRFYAFTQFKQEQLLSRLKRCSFQMKQLGAGVAVVAALGMATPAVGQVQVYDLVQRTGIANPLDTIINVNSLNSNMYDPIFVDIDADGDLDLFYLNFYSMTFFENTGTVYSPTWEARTGAANPLDGVVSGGFDFVDVDADGDKDLFTTNNFYAVTNGLNYYENQGSSTSPNFVLQTGTNPLDSVNYYLNNIVVTTASAKPSFVDIDDDGDMDCFLNVIQSYSGPTWQSDEKVWYFENQGNSSQADFFKQPKSNNPLYPLMQNLALDAWVTAKPIFFDAEKDGDLDLLLTINDDTFTGNLTTPFYENIGTPMIADFDSSLVQPLDSVLDPAAAYVNIYLVDIDGDNDLDVYRRSNGVPGRVFFENLDTTTTVNVAKIGKEETFNLFPNPTTGHLSFEEAITGSLSIYNIMGQAVLTKEVNNLSAIDLSDFYNGWYVLKIKMDKREIEELILIEK
jgi:hypothetical protein